MPDSKTKKPPEQTGIMAVRDASFTRIGADVSLTRIVDEDVDIALMIRQAAYKNIVMGENQQPETVTGGMTLLEVGRLRMPAQSGMLLAFNLLRSCAEADFFDLENFEEGMAEIRQIIVEADQSSPDQGFKDQ